MALEEIRSFNPERRHRRSNEMSLSHRDGKVSKFRPLPRIEIPERQEIRRRGLRGHDGFLHGTDWPIEQMRR